MVSDGLQFRLVVAEFELLFLEGFELFGGGFFGGGTGGDREFGLEPIDFLVEFDLEFEDVVGAEESYGVGAVAVEVDEGAEGTLFAAGEEPVDGAFFRF